MRLVTTFIQNTESTDPDLSYLNRARFVLSVADGHGSDGVGILDAVIRNRHLFLSMTSGAEIDAGSVFTEDDLPVASDSRLGIAAFDPAYFSILAGKVSLRGDLDFGLNETQLAEYLTANKYATQAWVAAQGFIGSDGLALYATKEWVLGQNFAKASSLGNYLLKSVWDEVFEVTTVNGVRVLNVKLDILGLKGITAYAEGSLSGGFSGALVDLVDVAVTNLASGEILKYNGTHFVNVPVSSIAGASSWDQITGKPEYYPTRWADVSGAPTSLPASDVYPWAKAASKPTYTAAEVGALALSGGTLTGNVITIGSFILANSGAYPQLTFRVTADNSERLLFRHGNDLKWRYNGTNDGIIYHSGNFNPSSKLDKSVWDEAFEIKTVDGVRVISAKLDFLSVAGISAYATGPSSGGGGGGLDYDLLKQALTGAITPDGYPFTISASFLGAIDKTYLTGKLANTYANKVHTHLWVDITDRPTALPANGGNADTVDNLHASSFAQIKSYTYPSGGVNNITDLDFTGNIQAHFPGAEYSCIWQGKDFAGTILQLKLRDYAGKQSMMYRGSLTKTWRTVWDSGNFDPDNKFGFSAAQLSDLNNAPNNAFFVGANNAANAPVAGSWSNGFTISYGNNPDFRKQFVYAGDKWWTRGRDGVNWGTWRQIWDSGNFNPDNYLLKTANAVSASKWATARTLTLTGSASGNVSMDGSANVSLSVTNNRLNSNSEMTYGWNGINYFNLAGTAGAAAKINDTPTTAWWHILRFNHGNSAGYYTDLAVPFNDNTLYYKRVTSGTLHNGGWVKIWDEKNANLSTVDWAAKNITAAGTVTAPTFVGDLSGSADKLFARYTGSGGQQGPGYFGKERFGCLMMNTPVNGNSHYKNWLICDAYSGSDAGGATAIGVDRHDMRVFAMSSDANRTSWNRSCELYTTVNANLSTVNWTANTLTATKLVLGGITIDVYNGALRVNGNLVATGGVTAYQ